MTSLTRDGALLAARILLALIFIMAGLGKLADVQGFAAYMEFGGVPGALAWPVILFEIGGGLLLLAGIQTRFVALALAAFSVATAVLYHFAPADQMQMTSFMKNLAMAGGYVALSISGGGRFALDRWFGARGLPA